MWISICLILINFLRGILIFFFNLKCSPLPGCQVNLVAQKILRYILKLSKREHSLTCKLFPTHTHTHTHTHTRISPFSITLYHWQWGVNTLLCANSVSNLFFSYPLSHYTGLYLHWGWGGSLVAQLVNNPPAMQKTPVWFLGWEDLLEKG